MNPATPVAGQVDARRRDPERTREDILRVATAEFASEGFAGARVDQIAAETATTKRMIYYYFGSKEGLYLQVIEAAYEMVRSLEKNLDIEGMSPVDALRQLAEFTYDHHTTHQDFIRLVQIENIHRAEHILQSTRIRDLNTTAIDSLRSIIERGVAEGVFRTDIDPLDAHMMISSYSIFAVANRHTFGAAFGRDMLDPSKHQFYRALAGDMIVATMTRV
jgi:AcrR family transcriptional regulator